ncbi:MAG: signal peptidase II [Lachnospiraceae bacterium]|nr:signal peptidase II [Lachnospiraceae bacterium]
MMDTKTKRSRGILIADIAIFIVTLFIDQLSKYLVRSHMQLRDHFDVIPGILQVFYHENTGATWGMLKGQTVFFIFMAVVVCCVLVFLILRIPDGKKYIRMHVALTLVLSGAIGNTIDRVMKASVTDFIYAVIINFPIFNVADSFIVVATAWLIIMVLFIYKDEDLAFMNLGRAEKMRRTDAKKEQEDEES